MRKPATLAILCVIAAWSSPAGAAVLYDASSSVLPESSPWTWTYAAVDATPASFTVEATHSFTSGAAVLDSTTDMEDMAGWAKTNGPSMDRSAGFIITFIARLVSESHSSDNRAGLSLTVTADEAGPLGIELGFRSGEVFAQNVDFTRGETASVDTTSALRTYTLSVHNTTYDLFTTGSANPILSGSLRNYPGGGITPYDIPNFIGVSDNTSSAQAQFQWTYLEVVPEPASISLLALGCLPLLTRRRTRPA